MTHCYNQTIEVWSQTFCGEEVSQEFLGRKNIHQLKDFLVTTLEISDEKFMRIEAAMKAGDELRVFDDEGSFGCNDCALMLVPIN